MSSYLFEDPHKVSGHTKDFRHSDANSYGFGFLDGEAYITPRRAMHANTFKNYEEGSLKRQKLRYLDRNDFNYPGRFWRSKKIISFWKYPSKNKIGVLLKKLEDEWRDLYVDVDDDNFRIQLHGRRGPIDFSSAEWGVEIWDDNGSKVVPLDQYQPPGETGISRTHTARLIDHREDLKSLVRDEINNLLKENPFSVPTPEGDIAGEISSDSYAFGFDRTGDVYIGDSIDHHDQICKRYEGYTTPSERSDFEYPGRFWKDEKVLSFWEYPSKYKIGVLLKKLEDEWKERFPEKDPLNFKKNDWYVEVMEDGDLIRGELVPLEDYQRSDDPENLSHTSRLTEQELKDLIKEELKTFIFEGEREGWWISPTNNFHYLTGVSNSHASFAFNNPSLVGISSNELEFIQKSGSLNKTQKEKAASNLAVLNGAVSGRVYEAANSTQLIVLGTRKGIEKAVHKIIKKYRKKNISMLNVLIYEDIKVDNPQDLLNMSKKNSYKFSLEEFKREFGGGY